MTPRDPPHRLAPILPSHVGVDFVGSCAEAILQGHGHTFRPRNVPGFSDSSTAACTRAFPPFLTSPTASVVARVVAAPPSIAPGLGLVQPAGALAPDGA